jgi:hypothetical protein
VFAAGNVLHPVESSGWAAHEGQRAGVLVAKFLAGLISARQGEKRIRAGQGLRYVVPQIWDEKLLLLPDVPKLRTTMRASADTARGRVQLQSASSVLWEGRARPILSSRRVKLDLSVLEGSSGHANLSVRVKS